MPVSLMGAPPMPLVRFAVETAEYRDNAGISHTRDVERIYVTPAGGAKNTHVAEAQEWIESKRQLSQLDPPLYPAEWVAAFQARYDAWKRGVELPQEGTPLRSWPLISPSELKRCLQADVLTVEQLAHLTEEGLDNVGMGARALKQKAETWIAEKTGPGALIEQNAALKAQVDDLGNKLAETTNTLTDVLAELRELRAERKADRDAEPEKRRGRQGQPPARLDADVIR
jgi:hypothetical protein